ARSARYKSHRKRSTRGSFPAAPADVFRRLSDTPCRRWPSCLYTAESFPHTPWPDRSPSLFPAGIREDCFPRNTDEEAVSETPGFLGFSRIPLPASAVQASARRSLSRGPLWASVSPENPGISDPAGQTAFSVFPRFSPLCQSL